MMPAIKYAGASVTGDLRARGTVARAAGTALVVLQMALAVVLLVGSGLMIGSGYDSVFPRSNPRE